MKKLFLSLVLVAGFAVAAVAQPRAIGARLGWGADFSYQHSVGEKNMVNLEVGIPAFHGIQAAATYDWVFPITSWQEKGTWNWYAGVGAGVGFYWGGYGAMSAGVAGRIGVEYNFWVPVQLSLDWRPIVGPYFAFAGAGYSPVVGYHVGGLYSGIALGVRYTF